MERIVTLAWNRGGIFDFEGGPSDRERLEWLMAMLLEFGQHSNQQEVRKKCIAHGKVVKSLLAQRLIAKLSIDANKLVVCTGYEVVVMPLRPLIPSAEFPDIYEEECRETLSQETNLYEIDNETPVWHSFWPLHDLFLERWDSIRRMATNNWSLDDEDPPATFLSITSEMMSSIELESKLMDTARWHLPSIHFSSISWRWLALITSPLSSDHSGISGDGHQLLHVFDVLADWNIQSESNYDERGVFFRNEEQEQP